MKKFVSCDWGTSAFRIRLIDGADLEVIAEVTTSDGIAATYNSWLATRRPAEERLMFYMDYLQEQLVKLKRESGILLQDIPVIISGMASSTIGMIEIPYKKLPFRIDGSDLLVRTYSSGKLIIVSGACTDDDVMRGEETKLIGCGLENTEQSRLMIFPGTHSKHLSVSDGYVTGFRTYMTGEFFDLLASRSILANSIKKPAHGAEDMDAFDAGIKKGLTGNFLHEAFCVRTNQVLKGLDAVYNHAYLSGVVIGSELQAVDLNSTEGVMLVCGAKLRRQYLRALSHIVPDDKLEFLDADRALIRGHQLICQHFA